MVCESTLRRTAVGAGAAALTAAGVAAYRAWLRQSGGAAPERIGYPPLATPKALAEGLWIVDDVMSASGLSLPIRMTVVRLANGDLLLHSPTPYSPELARAIEALGTIRHLVAPTFAHWTHLLKWQRAYRDATTWGVPKLRERGQVRRSGTRIDRDLAEDAPPEWRKEIRQGIIPGGGSFRECYFFHKPTHTLLLSDLVENLNPAKLPPVSREVMRAMAGTRGTTALHVRAVLIGGGDKTRQAVRAMVALAPERVVVGHGDFIETDAAARLRRGFAWLVR